MILDEVVSIEKIGIEKTVDIEVDGDHLFYCNDILTHNSAAGDVADISEENIQGGISKIQAADNVIGFIPNAQSREMGIMRAKFLKTRDSSGVGSTVDFKVDWSTLTFEPWDTTGENDPAVLNYAAQAQNAAQSLNTDQPLRKTTKGKKKPSGSDLKGNSGAVVKSDDEDDDSSTSGKKTKGIIKGLGGKKKKGLNREVKML